MGALLVGVSFFSAFLLGRVGLGWGMAPVVLFGGSFGIIRAQLLDQFSFFTYDAAVLGLYLSRWPTLERAGAGTPLRPWASALLGWPLVVLFFGAMLPQHLLIQLCGLRAAVWYIPFLLLGHGMTRQDFRLTVLWLSIYCMIALGFGVAEFRNGIEAFYPRSPVTELLYKSQDIETSEGFAFRIPATFSNAHTYGGFAVTVLPCILARVATGDTRWWERGVLAAGGLAATFSIFLCGARVPAVQLALLGVGVLYYLRVRASVLAGVAVAACIVGYVVSGEERLQRALLVLDSEATADRVGQSADLGLVDLFMTYPLGAGLGGAAGTNIPAFLQDLMTPTVGAENELVRIGIEQGIPGLALMLAFVGWLVWHQGGGPAVGVMRTFVFVSWATAFIGVGMMASIPNAALLLLQMGLIAPGSRLYEAGSRQSKAMGGRA